MNISLFGQELILITFGIVIGLAVYLCSKIDIKLRWIVLGIITVLGILASLLLVLITANITQSANELPGKFWLMIFPFTFSIFILPGILLTKLYIKKHTKPKRGRKKAIKDPVTKTVYIVAFWAVEVAVGLVFVLLITNNYYHYYPTLSTIFGIGQHKNFVLNQENKITLQYSNNGTVCK